MFASPLHPQEDNLQMRHYNLLLSVWQPSKCAASVRVNSFCCPQISYSRLAYSYSNSASLIPGLEQAHMGGCQLWECITCSFISLDTQERGFYSLRVFAQISTLHSDSSLRSTLYPSCQFMYSLILKHAKIFFIFFLLILFSLARVLRYIEQKYFVYICMYVFTYFFIVPRPIVSP